MELIMLKVSIFTIAYIIVGMLIDGYINRNDPTKMSIMGTVISPILVAVIIFFTIVILPIAIFASAIDTFTKK